MNSFEHYQAGNLSDALETALSEVRNNPSDIQSRAFLAELLCFSNDFERADKQLSTIASIDVKTSLTISTWRQLLTAAQIREDVFQRQGSPELIDQPTEQITQTLNNLISLNTNDSSFVEQAMVEQKVTINGKPVSTWRDLDDLHAYTLEVLASNGKYFWVDFSQIAELSFHAPERPLDLLWRKANILLTSGSEGQVFVPTIYPSTSSASDQDPLFALGRKTDWQETNNIVRGIGLRTWLVGDECLSIMDIESIQQDNQSKTAASA